MKMIEIYDVLHEYTLVLSCLKKVPVYTGNYQWRVLLRRYGAP